MGSVICTVESVSPQFPGSSRGSAPVVSLPVLDSLLADQQQLTAVEKFSQRHASATRPAMADAYRDLIPLSRPKPGEQYAFEVDLDACSGCKACVAACHNLNGLEEHETWRNVGVLYGGTDHEPFLQHVTTSCHHCLEPACLTGCPVKAYDKDPETGIVRHLDDQCIGCQYCVFMCPYDVPQYSSAKGIVRKCDMCHDRLAVGEAPACVQSCPNQAIRIRTVRVESVAEQCEAGQFLPTAPEPGATLPTTTYKSRRSMPRNLLPRNTATCPWS
jgi:formate dehydrogenase iron-sulfur subunit